jgi:ERI1 exoribonuclease 3
MASPQAAAPGALFAQQRFDWFIVLDFEAQCERDAIISPQEIIEFPALLIDGRTFDVVAEFHHYVRPTVHKQLTRFCTELTGITQDQVEQQPELPAVLGMFNDFLVQHGLLHDGSPPSFTFVTCGNWDLQTCLPNQAAFLGIKLPSYFRRVRQGVVAFLPLPATPRPAPRQHAPNTLAPAHPPAPCPCR